MTLNGIAGIVVYNTSTRYIGKEYNTVHGILEKEGILKHLDKFPQETREYIRKKLGE